MGRLHLKYLHSDYFYACKSCSTHIASIDGDIIDNKGFIDLIDMKQPSQFVNFKIEKVIKAPYQMFIQTPLALVKCIQCLEVIGKIENKRNIYNTLLFSNPEDSSLLDIDAANIVEEEMNYEESKIKIDMSKLSIKSTLPIVRYHQEVNNDIEDADHAMMRQTLESSFYQQQNEIFSRLDQ
jgi:hypothetical protein